MQQHAGDAEVPEPDATEQRAPVDPDGQPGDALAAPLLTGHVEADEADRLEQAQELAEDPDYPAGPADDVS